MKKVTDRTERIVALILASLYNDRGKARILWRAGFNRAEIADLMDITEREVKKLLKP